MPAIAYAIAMDLYTRSGDDGTTGLFGAGRVSKDHLRVTAYGDIDELNAALGLAVAACTDDDPTVKRIGDMLRNVQNALFDLGADLATPPGSKHEDQVRRVSDAHVRGVETAIDEVDAGNSELKQFILPGGTELAGRLHLARTVCRRAERALVALTHSEPINGATLIYLNRLGDLLFAMARRVNKAADRADVTWQHDGGTEL